MSFTLISVSILLFMALAMGLCACNGYRIGAVKSAISLSLLLICAFCSTFLSNWFSFIFEDVARDIIGGLGIVSVLSDAFGNVNEIIAPIVEAVAALFSYIPVFLLVYWWCLWIARTAYTSKVTSDSAPECLYQKADAPYCVKHTKEIGAGLGVLFGFILSIVLVSPIAGLFKTADNAIYATEKFFDDSTLVSSTDDVYYASDDFMVNVIYSIGGETIVDLTTYVSGGKGLTSIKEEFEILSKLSADDVTYLFDSIQSGNKIKFNSAIDTMESSVLYKNIVFGISKNAFASWEEGGGNIDTIELFDSALPPIRDCLKNAIQLCCNGNADHFKECIQTVFNVVSLSKGYWLDTSSSEYKRGIDAAFDSALLNDIRRELNKNSDMSNLRYYFDDLAIYVMANEIFNSASHSSAEQEELFDRIATIRNESDYYTGGYTVVSSIAAELSLAFNDYGMYIPEEADDYFATKLIDAFPFHMELSANDISFWLSSYLSN